ncbi:methyltransferase [Saccharopolyspora indica]|uniref:methyltransferase n=1 Tax=Saccharopolyspora indica TaxID=1229659 RepID=UPI0022EA1A12|nr:methyltransferase [Saccharopolyspora indica]MDA3645318.1 methyltransferase [Saccharopolyspora indica]
MMESSVTRGDAHRLMQWLSGATATQVLSVVTRLDLADAIGDQARDVEDLAVAYGIPAERLARLLRAAAAMGLCAELAPGKFELTATGGLLRRGTPDSLYGTVRLVSAPVTQKPWLQLETSVRTGRAAFDEVFGQPVFEYFANEPEMSAVYDAAMGEYARGVAASLPEHYDFGRFSSVTDVGGGNGTLLTAVLRRHPGLTGVVFDDERVVPRAIEVVQQAGLSDRCEVVSGDFFRSVPRESDLYLLKSIVHDWEDEQAVQILRRCREAMTPGNRLLILEPVLPDMVDAEVSEELYFRDLHMLVLYGGRERTRGDFEQLCSRAGLVIDEIIPLPPETGHQIIETAPA